MVGRGFGGGGSFALPRWPRCKPPFESWPSMYYVHPGKGKWGRGKGKGKKGNENVGLNFGIGYFGGSSRRANNRIDNKLTLHKPESRHDGRAINASSNGDKPYPRQFFP